MKKSISILILTTVIFTIIGCKNRPPYQYGYVIAEGVWAVQEEADIPNPIHDVLKKRRFNFGDRIKLIRGLQGYNRRTGENVPFYEFEFEDIRFFIKASDVSNKVAVTPTRTIAYLNPENSEERTQEIPAGVAMTILDKKNGYLKVNVRYFTIGEENAIIETGERWVRDDSYLTDPQSIKEAFFYFYALYYNEIPEGREQAEFFTKRGLELSTASGKNTPITELLNNISN